MRYRAAVPLFAGFASLWAMTAVPVGAQQPSSHAANVTGQVVTSTKVDAINVTVYRDPNRDAGGEINTRWLQGFALITETRTIALPQGETRIRFEGVADGIIAVSAVVTGLPGGVVQKNRDAALLSPASLLDGTLGNHVTLKRTNKATGKVIEQDAIIRSGPEGAVLQTEQGFESLRCSGLPETLVYDNVPAGLTAKPTLSVVTRNKQAVTATVQLTYLATGFDWAANYVATVNDDGKTLDLFAWLTVANSNEVSFPDAQLMAVAGSVNKESNFNSLVARQPSPSLNLECYPTGSGRMAERYFRDIAVPQPPPPPSPVMADLAVSKIVVTGNRRSSPAAVVAMQEQLGDLKLYRVPVQMSVAANQQKQVALLVKDKVPFRQLYIYEPSINSEIDNRPMSMELQMKNRSSDNLGIPLPSGKVAFYRQAGDKTLLAAQSNLDDYAVDQEVKLKGPQSSQVRISQNIEVRNKKKDDLVTLTVTNADPFAVEIEVRLEDEGDMQKMPGSFKRRDGRWIWAVTVPAHGTQKTRYRLVKEKS